MKVLSAPMEIFPEIASTNGQQHGFIKQWKNELQIKSVSECPAEPEFQSNSVRGTMTMMADGILKTTTTKSSHNLYQLLLFVYIYHCGTRKTSRKEMKEKKKMKKN